MIHIGITGTRQGINAEQAKTMRELLGMFKVGYITVHHGCCVGADNSADWICRQLNIPMEYHPAEGVKKYQFTPEVRKGDILHEEYYPLVRNNHIVLASDRIYAFPKENEEVLRSGTWATIRTAKKEGKQLTILYPDGGVDEFNY